MARKRGSSSLGRLAGLFGLIVLLVVLLAGCVMPDGSVYTMPTQTPALAEKAPTAVAVGVAPIEVESSPAEPYLEQGQEYASMGDYESALTEYTKAVEADPNDPLAYSGRGLAYAILGELESAGADLDRALALAPDDPDALSLRGEVRWYLGDAQGAAEDYDRLLTVTSGGEGLERMIQQSAYLVRGLTRADSGDLTGAVADYEQVLRINPWLTDLFGELHRLSQNANLYEEKMAEYDRYAAEATSPGRQPFAEGMKHLLRAQLMGIPEEYSAAVDALTVAIDADPELAEAYHGRAVASINAAKFAEGSSAQISFDEGVVTFTDPETGEIITQSQDEYDADRAAEEAATLATREGAIDDLNRALELDPTPVEVIHDLGVAHFAQQVQYYVGFVYVEPDENGREMALEMFDRAVEAAPDWEQARLSRAQASLYWGTHDSFAYLSSSDTEVHSLAYVPDGSSLLSVRTDLSFDVWDTENGELLMTSAGPKPGEIELGAHTLSFSPDRTRLVTAGTDQVVRVWDAATGEAMMALEGHEFGLEDARFSPDGSLIASAGNDMVRLWDAESGELLLELEGSGPIAFSPDGLRLVSSDAGPDLAVWDVQTGERVKGLFGPVDATQDYNEIYGYLPESLVYSPDGSEIAAVSSTGALRVWDLEAGDTALVLSVPGDEYIGRPSVAYSPDSAFLISRREDGRLSVWEVASGAEVAIFGENESVPVYSPDGAQIASAGPGGTVNLRDARSGELLMALERPLSPETMALQTGAIELLETALEDANFLIDRQAADGWPYYVRAAASFALAETIDGETDEDLSAQVDADFATFAQLSPDVRLDDVFSEAPAQVRFSRPGPPASPLMAGRIEDVDNGRLFVHDAAGIQFQIPAQGPTGRLVDMYVPDGPAYIVMVDDFRRFEVLMMDAELGELSAEQWLSQELAPFGIADIERVDAVETEYGEATIVAMADFGSTVVLLPVDNRIFYFSYSPVPWAGGEQDDSYRMFASGYGLQLEPGSEVVAELVSSLSLLEE